jgi:hypothetical protein
MIINKSLEGNWCKEKTSYIDDVAYQLYVRHMFETYDTPSLGPQKEFIYYRYGIHNLPYRFYNEAEKILRREKLEKLNDI